ncbi:MAG TPA: DsbA family oxidoreductase [Burkholderiales bacterium]|nr:DsbA family oxidoreductase [Burkholderiales bacterium]
MALRIDIISDVVCPWCFIGKRNLDAALRMYRAQYPEAEAPVIRWLPFQLNPDLPVEGMPRREYTSQKFGGPDNAREIYARVEAAGAHAGIAFEFGRIAVQPNTLQAHRVVHFAARENRQGEVVESLFQGYFLEGCDLTRAETLADLAARGGLHRESLLNYLRTDEDRDLIARQDMHARQIGIQGVPFFIVAERLGVSGAQPPGVLFEVMEQAQSESAISAAPQ